MAAEFMPSDGIVVEFADKGKFHLGLVVHVDEKTGKCRLIQETGRDATLPAKQILHALPCRLSTSLPVSNIQTELGSLDKRAQNLLDACHVDEIWELVVYDESEVSLDDILSLVFDHPDAAQKLAMIRALRADKLYFKGIQPERFAPRPANVVEDLKRQLEAKAQKDAWRDRFAQEAAGFLGMTPQQQEEARENEFFLSSGCRDAWEIVEQYAVHGSEYQDRAEAEALLETLQKRINRGFPGTAQFRARAFLRQSGYWDEQTNVALIKYEVPDAFDDSVEKQAHEIYMGQPDESGREDLTHLNVFSIDDAETLDVDDAISIERLEDGNVRLGVHIAAPASVIPFDSPLEVEARRRATSIYLPEKRIPMVPAILSENALSLLQDKRRNAISFMMTFSSEFTLLHSEILPSVIISKHKLSYDTVEQLLEIGNDNLSDEIRLVQEITEFSAASRRSHGAIDIDLPEYKLSFDRESSTYKFEKIDPVMMSRQLVAECMILANHVAAEFCSGNGIPALYRIQPPPVNMPRQDTLDALPNDYMRAYAMRRCMQPAASSMTPSLHAGLGLDQYLQATSPLRRYADLICHYQLESWFSSRKPRFTEQEFNAVLTETDLGLTHARSASHESLYTSTLAYLKQIGNEPLEAIIIQYNAERGDMAQVVLIDTQIRANVATRNRWPLGTLCTVSIDHVNPEEGSLLLKFIDIIA